MIRSSVLGAFAAAFLAGAAQAATVVTVSTTVSPAVTVFAGLLQESTLTPVGCPGFFLCASSVTLTQDVAKTAITHALNESLGANDGTGLGPIADFDIVIDYLVNGHAFSLTQAATFRQIANDQFFLVISASATHVVDLGLDGLLRVTANSQSSQSLSGGLGGPVIRSTFLLSAPAAVVPEPATWALMIGGMGLAGSALRARRRPAFAA